jgi:FKBP-type peptidyl-prolyl cis-trans isomerase FklB
MIRVLCKKISLVLFGALMFQAQPVNANGDELNTKKDRISYSLGHQIGTDLLAQGHEVDSESLKAGIQDGLSGKEPRISPEKMQEVLAAMKRRIIARQRNEKLEMREQRLLAGKKFLEDNAKREGVIVLPSGLQYEVLKEGNGPGPGPTDQVTIHYEGTFLDGRVVGSSRRKGSPETFSVNGVMKGLSEALQLMKVGAHWKVFIPPELGIGNRGELRNRTLIYDVELLKIKTEE